MIRNTIKNESKNEKDLLNDKSLLEKSNYEIITNEELTKDDILQISQLYNQLYIEKYSAHNPMFTPAYLWNALQHRLFEIKAIKKGIQLMVSLLILLGMEL